MTPLSSFVHEHLGEVEVLGRPRAVGMTRVVHVRDAGGRAWFAKRVLIETRWRSESRGYDLWAGLPGVLSPRARCDDRRCILLPRAPGRHRSGRSPRAMALAGATLRRLHDAPAPPGWIDNWRDVAATQVDRLLVEIPEQGVAVDRGLVRAHQIELLGLALDDVPTHGDYQPHNWFWRGPRRRMTVLDFEVAALRPAVYDIARLRYATCWQRPDLHDALLTGYGRALSDVEQRFLDVVLPWRALVAIGMGLRNRRDEMVVHGLGVLDALARGDHAGTPGVRRPTPAATRRLGRRTTGRRADSTT